MSSFSTTLTSAATYIAADPKTPKEIVNVAGGTVFHKNAPDVDSDDTSLAKGSSVQITEGKYFISATKSEVVVRELSTVTVEDITTVDDLTVGDDLTVLGKQTIAETLAVTGATTPTGGVASSGALPGAYTGAWSPNTATAGTDTFFAEKQLFLASLWLPANKTITGIGFLVGSVGGTNKAVVGLFNAAGEVLAKSTEVEEGTLVGTAAQIQEIAFTAAYAATGPRLYYVGITANGATAKLRTILANVAGKNIFTDKVELAAKNVLATVVAPTTFTADEGPVGFVF